ncbi:MAG: amidase [Roseiarcus sp.]|jgi:Asp-tRNA(Asn)/Glu-tRNA(Gln) amidotransferase A subunit family amidase
MSDLIHLSASEAARMIARRELSSEELVTAHLDHIARRDEAVRAWAYLSADDAIRQAQARDRNPAVGPLHGVPVGIKDMTDTHDMPTSYGSPIYAGHRPVADAVPVALLRAAGAVILGKTVTTEFAFRHPGPTRNPHDPERTPGGSSSGSAAAVADCQVPVATGTQSGGSIIRPAAFCGVVGFKPTFDAISTQGTKQLAWSLDTFGLFARSIDDIALFLAVMTGSPSAAVDASHIHAPRIGLCQTSVWHQADDAARAAVETAARRLAAEGARVIDVELPSEARDIQEIHRAIIGFEMNIALSDERLRNADRLSIEMREQGLPMGAAVSFEEYQRCRDNAEAARRALGSLFDDFDALITPSAVGEASLGLNSTGSAVFSNAWSILHVPCLALPTGSGPNGLPIGIQLVGKRGEERDLLNLSEWVSRRLA